MREPTRAILIATLLAATAALAIARLRPPPVIAATAPAERFSAERALPLLQQIARVPHPVGSPANVAVRELIVARLRALGLEPELQATTAVRPLGFGTALSWAGSVTNVYVRLRGRQPGRALLLMAHYDSAPVAPGAADDGSGVVALVETLRALRAGPPLAHDVIALFTDGEEMGLLGAQAFVAESPAARDVALAINVEARGASGPSLMFETSPGNGRLVRALFAACPHAATSSLMYEVYRLLRNDTDLSVLKQAGVPGLNFAFVGDLARYHTPGDTVAHLDARSLQDQGTQLLALARHFAAGTLERLVDDDVVYFDVLRLGGVVYAKATALLLALVLAGAWLTLAWRSCRRKQTRARAIVAAALLALLSLVVASGVLWLVVAAILRLTGLDARPWGDSGPSLTWLVGLASLGLASTTAPLRWVRRRCGETGARLGVLLVWLVLATLTTRLLPGASFLFAWPLAFALAALARPSLAVRVAAAVATLFVFVPSAYLVLTALGTQGCVAALPLVLLLLQLLAVTLAGDDLPLPLLVTPARLLGIAALAIAVSVGATLDDASRARCAAVFYTLDHDRGRARLSTLETGAAPPWVLAHLVGGARREPLPDVFPAAFFGPLDGGDAPAVPLPGPSLEIRDVRDDGDARAVELVARAAPGAATLLVFLDGAPPLAVSVADRALPVPARASGRWGLIYSAPPDDGVHVRLRLPRTPAARLTLVDERDGLPALDGAPLRPETRTLSPWGDHTAVIASFTL